MDYQKTAREIYDGIGGKSNLVSAAHCATRLRLVIGDNDKCDKEKVEEIDGVQGVFFASGQMQIILGTGTVNKVYDEFIKIAGIEGSSKEEVKQAAKPVAKPEAKPVEKQPAKMTAETEAALRELRVTPAEGTPATEKGSLQKIENTTVPLLQYALMKGNTHVYYVCADHIKLADLGDKELTFHGRSFKVPGWRVPILYVESLTPAVE